MSGWRHCALGDVMTLKRGHDLPESSRREGAIPIISSSGVTGFHSEAKAASPGVITGRYGTIGEVYYVEEDYWPLNTALYVVDFHGNHPRFVAYFLKHVLKGYQSDKAAVPGVDRNVLHAMPVKAPDTLIQTRIADILSAYDDLMENNRRRMALLEESARLLYREWFVHLRFPGHERTRIVDGVPEGWERKALGELSERVDYGFTASADMEADGPKFLRITDIVPSTIDWSFVPHCEIHEERLPRFELAEGDIVVARTGATVGYAKRINKLHPSAVFASYLVRFRVCRSVSNLLVGVFA